MIIGAETPIDDDTVVSFSDWHKQMRSSEGSEPGNGIIDIGVFYNIHRKFSIKGFMTGPVGLYKGKPLTARTVLFKEYQHLINWVKCDQDRIFPYLAMYYPSIPQYFKTEEGKFQPVPLETPTYTEAHWKFRFALLENNDGT